MKRTEQNTLVRSELISTPQIVSSRLAMIFLGSSIILQPERLKSERGPSRRVGLLQRLQG